jgi:hypothetical protein
MKWDCSMCFCNLVLVGSFEHPQHSLVPSFHQCFGQTCDKMRSSDENRKKNGGLHNFSHRKKFLTPWFGFALVVVSQLLICISWGSLFWLFVMLRFL